MTQRIPEVKKNFSFAFCASSFRQMAFAYLPSLLYILLVNNTAKLKMTNKAHLEITGFVDAIDPPNATIQVGNLWIQVAAPQHLMIGDLVAVEAAVSSEGHCVGVIKMHLQRPIAAVTTQTSNVAPLRPAAAPVAAPSPSPSPPARPASPVAAPTAQQVAQPAATSRAARFGGARTVQQPASAPVQARSLPPSPSRPSFDPNDPSDADVPF